MKTYLITGGAGFIGSNFIHYLMEKEHASTRILNLDALAYSANRDNVCCYETNPQYTFIQGNICDEELVHRLFTDHSIDYVVHFAAQTHVDRSIASAKEFVMTNVLGTLNLLQEAEQSWSQRDRKDKRFLYISTDEVYGELTEAGYFTETTPLNPRNPYAASKASGDMLARSFFTTHGLPVLVTRCSNNYGPYQYEEKFLPNCIKCCLTGREIPIYGDGKNIRDWLYVTDHCRAIDLVLQQGQPGEVYNVGGHNEHTNLEMVKILGNILREEYRIEPSPIRFIEDRKGHDRRYAIHPAKLMEELGWQPEVPFGEGIRRTVRWYLEHPEFLHVD